MSSDATLVAPAPTKSAESRRLAWWEHLGLLWGLRLTLARGSLLRNAAWLPTLLGSITLIGLTVGAFRGTSSIFSARSVLDEPQFARFLLLLLGFLASMMWIMWPVVTASIDDAAELSRFSLFPVTPKRLFLASVLAGLVEPRTLPIWGALLGAASGLHEAAHVRWTVALPATIALALCSVVWGRVGLHLLLNVLRSRRSAETLGGGLLVMLFGAAFVPPPDLSWLRDFDATAPQVDDALLQGSIDLFTLLPTGGWGTALFFDAARLRGWIPVALLYLALAIVVGYVLAYWLLARFHRRAGRALPQRIDEERRRQTYQHQSLARVLIERELRDLWLNPRTRMTLALPFFLAILLKLVGARALAMEFVGPLTDAYLIGGVASYGAFVLAGGLSQNAFGYDAGGAQLLFFAPVEPRQVLRAKNLVHGGVGLTLCLVLIAFYALYIAIPAPWVLLLAVSNAAFQVLLFVALGNLLSILTPRKFHPSLKRRDRASALAISVGLGAASLAVMPGLFVVRHAQTSWEFVAGAIVVLPLVGWTLWRISVPAAMTLLSTRRAELLRAVARE